MSVEGHIQALKSKKIELEKQLEEAENSPSVDDLTLQKLKKEKLRIKDELTAHGIG